MSGAHTPGEWKFQAYPRRAMNGTKYIDYDVSAPCDDDESSVLEYLTEGDARLISAAPDLLAACEALIARFPHGGALSDSLIREEMDAMRAAAAKARGA